MSQYETDLKDKKLSGMNAKVFTAFSELCRFADEYGYVVELEKPFVEFEQLFLKVLDEDGNEVKKITLKDISSVNKVAGKVLNELSKCVK